MSVYARLVWAYLPCHADREGRLRDAPFTLKHAILPGDDVDMNALLVELAERKHIVRYEVDGRRFIQIRSFLRHQNPHPREAASEIPAQGQPEVSPRQTLAVPSREKALSSPADPDPDLDLIPDPDPGRERIPAPAIPVAVVPERPRAHIVAAATVAFLDCYSAYPNQNGKNAAAQEWQFQASAFVGGEAALRETIMRRFDAGMLRNHPYSEGSFCPNFEKFLRERRWEDPESKPARVATGPPVPVTVGYARASSANHKGGGTDHEF